MAGLAPWAALTKRRGEGGDAREVAEEVQGRALGREDRTQQAVDVGGWWRRFELVAVGRMPREVEVGADWGGTSRSRRPGRRGRRGCGPGARTARCSLGDERRREVAGGPEVLGQRPCDRVARPPAGCGVVEAVHAHRTLGRCRCRSDGRGGGAVVERDGGASRVGLGVVEPGVRAPALRAGRCARPAAHRPPGAGWPTRRRGRSRPGRRGWRRPSSTTRRALDRDSALRTTPAPRVMARCRHVARVWSTSGAVDDASAPVPRRTTAARVGQGGGADAVAGAVCRRRRGGRRVASGPLCPAGMRSARRAPNTMPSSSELEASRLAPCTPVHATSPTAHRPGSALAPRRGR